MGYFYLWMSTLLVVVWALCYKVAVKQNCELKSVNLWLYVSSTVFMLVYFMATGHKYCSAAAWLGLLTGITCYIATLTFFYHIRTGVLAVSWTVIGLAVGFPVAASIVFWGEHPTLKQDVGLALIPIAVILCNPGKAKAVAK